MADSQSPDRVAAEWWFLNRGLGSMLTRRARWRRLWRRSAPALAGFATLMAGILLITLADKVHRGGGDNPTPAQWLVIAVLVAVLPAALLVAKKVGHVEDDRRRRLVASGSVLVALICDLFSGPTSNTIADVSTTLGFVALVVLLNGLGVGAVFGWGIRMTEQRLVSIGGLTARALPAVLLTVLVFFNGSVWSMAATITTQRMAALITFMTLIAVAFLTTGIDELVRPIMRSTTLRDTDQSALAGTPFATMTDPAVGYPLSRGEKANVLFVVIASAVAQLGTVALVTVVIFIVLGLVALTPDVMADWSHHGPTQDGWFGITLPLPQALFHVSLFLGGLTFMYLCARAVADKEYRVQFVEPLIDDLRLTLVARNRYRHHIAAGTQ